MTIAPVGPSMTRERVLNSLMHTVSTESTLGVGIVEHIGGQLTLSNMRLIWANMRLGDLLSTSSTQLCGAPMARFLVEPTQLWLRHEREVSVPVTMRSAGDEEITLDARISPTDQGTWTLMLSPRGATALREANEELTSYQHRFHALVERSPIPTLASDEGMRLGHVNDAFASMIGVTAGELTGTGWLSYIHEEDMDLVFECVEESTQGSVERMIRILTASGDERRAILRLSNVTTSVRSSGFAGTIEDITERFSFEQRLSYQAKHDQLTGLANRNHLMEHLSTRMKSGGVTVLFVDLDNFKTVNDELGHAAGDGLLKEVAHRLQAVIRDGDHVARFGGDEFVIVGAETHNDEEAMLFGQRILNSISPSLRIRGVSITPTASVGVARSQAGSRQSADDLLRESDIALYRAKGEGKNRVSVCNDAARDEARKALTLAADLRAAIRGQDLQVHFQPIIQLDIDKMCSVEALVRWTHPTQGYISPEVFVPIAEQNGMINDLTRVVLLESCEQMVRWQAELGADAPQRVNVNLSALQLSENDLVDTVRAILEQTGLAPQALCLEITEGLLMNNPDACRRVLTSLKKLGVWLAIDDFGTGYSSLSRLRHFPLDFLKIDKSFVNEMSEGHPEVVAAVIGLARSLKMRSVAEGVENAEQVEQLRRLGCTHIQGWHYAKAMTSEELITWAR